MGASKTNGKYVALLRGINVGGKNRLSMDDLKHLIEGLGCSDVTTYIQSGNAIFRAANLIVRDLVEQIVAHLESDFGLRVPVVIRSSAELIAASSNNPFLGPNVDPKNLHVAFLGGMPDPELVRGLDPYRSPGDHFQVVGKEIYINCPGGLARSKLTNRYFDSNLNTTATLRNWNTVQKLAGILDSN